MNSQTITMIGNMSWGMYKFRADLMRDLLARGHRVIVIAPKDEWSQEFFKLGCEFVDLQVDRKGVNPFKDLAYTLKLTSHLLRLKPNVTLAYTIKPVLYGSLAAWLASVPQRIAITTGLGHTFGQQNWISRVVCWLYKFCLKFATQVWFLNQEDLSAFLQQKLVHPHKTFILPGEGVDTDFYQPRDQKNHGLTFTLIARMLWDKGVGQFVECAQVIKKTHPQATFYLVGPVDDGNPEAVSRQQLEEWNAQGAITWLGPVNDVREILASTTCLIHPTYYKEGLPRVLMEANAMGIPCITTNIPGCRDVIADGKNGFLVPIKEVSSLIQAVQKFALLQTEDIQALAQNARQVATENFSSQRISGIYFSKLNL